MQWTKIEPPRRYASIPGMDPRAEWLLGPGLQDYLFQGEDMRIPFILNLQDAEAVRILNNRLDLGIFIDRRQELEPGKYITALATNTFFDDLAEGKNEDFRFLRESAKEIKLGAALPAASWAATPLQDPPIGPPPGGWPDQTVIIGIIDDGIAFAHERFRTAGHGSRVQCFWRMDPPDTSPTVAFGHEVWKAFDSGGGPAPGSIDDMLVKSTPAGWLDEEDFYRRARLIDFADAGHKGAAWRIAHGTHVLDLAAGEDPADDVLDRPIIAVQLPTATTRDTSGGSDLVPLVEEAIDYIIRRADLLGGDRVLPVVINFSYGLLAGPHDGTSQIEAAIDQRIADEAGRLRVVLPAGNSHLSRCHAEIKFKQPGQVVELAWRVQPDDRTPSHLEIWLAHESAQPPTSDRIRLSVRSPGGAQSPVLGEIPNAGVHLLDVDGSIVCAASYFFRSGPTERGFYLVELQPTARLQPTTDPIAPSGVWKIRLENVSLECDQPVHAWIQRDDSPYGYPICGRQSYFDEACYARFDAQGREIEEDSDPEQGASPCHVKRAGLVNGIATGEQPVVMGSYRRKDYRLAKYSAGEPITPKQGGAPDANFRKPDAVAATDDSLVHGGVLAAGSRSGSRVAMNGTSMAAPQITRWIADQLANGDPSDRGAVKVFAINEDPPPPAPPLSAQRGGWGRIGPWGKARRALDVFTP